MHPPLALTKARMYGFFVPGDAKALQASVDATLNAGAGDQAQFVVVCPLVLMTFTDIARAYSLWQDDQAKGWGREVDIVAWVLVAKCPPKGELPSLFYAYPLHIWVDDCMALIVGREVFGYPKYLCSYTMPGPQDPPQQFTLSAKGFQPYSPDTELREHPLLEVTGEALLGDGRPVGNVDEWRDGLLAGLQESPDFWCADPSWRKPFDDWFMQFPAMPQIFLKQFPDAAGKQAVYQAIVTADAQVQAIHQMKFLGGDYHLNLHEFASFPLAQTLGWKLGEQKAWLGYRIDFDFQVEPGVELVNNTFGTEAR
jgi:hypothetical protein